MTLYIDVPLDICMYWYWRPAAMHGVVMPILFDSVLGASDRSECAVLLTATQSETGGPRGVVQDREGALPQYA